MNYFLITLAVAAVGLAALTAPARAGRWREVWAGAVILAAGYLWAVLAAAGVRMPNPTDLTKQLSGAILKLLGGWR